ncbi:uncharacterized protein Mlc1 isoform X1 [Cherax quadricarinatus]|uniref:uncharacterized protein Mlc1 isoform X1 n=1 Tax=Cherax quadricarinatus TaxID=27406 RepID=UPI00387E5CFA
MEVLKLYDKAENGTMMYAELEHILMSLGECVVSLGECVVSLGECVVSLGVVMEVLKLYDKAENGTMMYAELEHILMSLGECVVSLGECVVSLGVVMEVLKLYDKAENGTMMYAELEHILMSLGERLEKSELEPVLKECCNEEDEDGFIPYEPFLTKLCKDIK